MSFTVFLPQFSIIAFVPPSKQASDQKLDSSHTIQASSSHAVASKQPTQALSSSSVPLSNQISIIDLYGARGSTLLLFEAMGIEKDALLTLKDVRSLVEHYVKSRELVDTKQPRTVKMDALLANLVFQREENVEFMARDALVTR